MEQHEEGNNSFRFPMYDMSVGEGKASVAFRVVATVRDPGMGVGAYYHGFYFETAQNQKRQ